MAEKVIIIGAGIGGLATANLLAKAGMEVHVYEKESSAGGRAGQINSKGFVFDSGPSWYLMPEVFEHYYSLLSQSVNEHLDLIRLEPAYKVFFEKQPPITITSDLSIDAKKFESIEPGAGKALKQYVKTSNKIYKLSLDHFLYTNFSSFRDFLKPAVIKNSLKMIKMAIMPLDKYVSKFVRDIRLKQILEYPMVFLGTSPFSAPALYSLMSALDFKEGVFYPKGGIYQIIKSLQTIGNQLNVNYHFGSEVSRIISRNGKATGIKLKNGEIIKADIVISNSDLHFTETELLSNKDQTYPEEYWTKKQASPSALLVYLGVKGKIAEFNHHNLLFVDEWKQNFEDIYTNKVAPKKASLYICNPSKSDSSVAPKDTENVFILVPLPAGIELSRREETKLVNHYLAQIKQMTKVDLTKSVITKKVFGPNDFKSAYYSWQSSMLGPSHILKQSAFFRTPNKSKKLGNLYYVGAGTTPGIGLPMCLIGAELIYKRLAKDNRGGRVSEIVPIKKGAN